MNHIATIAVIALLVSPAVHAAKMYRWVDENGVTHYSTRKPPPENADQDRLKGGTLSPRDTPSPSELADIEKRDLYNRGWEGCLSELCSIVRQLDPQCASSYCSQAKRFSKNCTSVSCRASKLGFQREMEERLAVKRRQEQGSGTFRSAAPSRAASRGESDQERLNRLVKQCEREGGADCDTEHLQRRMLSTDAPLGQR